MIQQSVIRDEDNETADEDRDSDGDISADENGVIAKSSNDDESDSENGKMLQPRNSRPGRPCTTYLTRQFS